MEVKVDKRVEFINMIQQISDCKFKKQYPHFFKGTTKYIEKIYKDFEKYKDREVMKLYADINGFTFGVPLDYAFTLNNEYKPTGNFGGKGESIEKFKILLPAFAKEIKFDEWFESNRKFYNKITQDYSKFLENGELEDFMRWFYKMDYDESRDRFFILMPSMGRRINFNKSFYKDNKIIGQACCVSVAEEKRGIPTFVEEYLLKESNATTALHEFSHGIINGLVDSYFRNKEFFSIDTDKTKEINVYHGVGVFNDTIIEAVVHIYLRKRGCFESSMKRLQERQETGFIYIEPLIEFLKQYIDNIDKYNSFSEFLPKAMTFLKEKQSEVE